MRNKEIAYQIGTTEQVIKNYLRKVYDKLGVSDRLELASTVSTTSSSSNTAAPAAATPTVRKSTPSKP